MWGKGSGSGRYRNLDGSMPYESEVGGILVGERGATVCVLLSVVMPFPKYSA